MRFIDATDIRRVLTLPVLIDALEAAHRRPKMEVQNAYLGSEGEQYFLRHAVDPGRFMASKLITSFPGNLATGKFPAVQAVFVLFDGRDGHPLAVIDGTELTYWRTAADSGLGARLLAPPEPETLLVVGAGGLSRWLVRAHLTARPSLRRIRIWNRTASRAAETADLLAEEGIVAEPVTELDAAVRDADIVSTCTRSHQPLIKGVHLRPGAHLDLVGGYSRATREADDEACRRGAIFVDLRESAFDGVGDILEPIARGVIGDSDVKGDLYDLVAGRIGGRRSRDEITIFKNAGGAHLDLMTAETIVERLGAMP